MSKRKNPEELSTLKIIGRILLLLALPILIIVAVLQNMPNKDLGAIGLLLVIVTFMVFIGVIFSHLPQERMDGKNKNAKERMGVGLDSRKRTKMEAQKEKVTQGERRRY